MISTSTQTKTLSDGTTIEITITVNHATKNASISDVVYMDKEIQLLSKMTTAEALGEWSGKIIYGFFKSTEPLSE